MSLQSSPTNHNTRNIKVIGINGTIGSDDDWTGGVCGFSLRLSDSAVSFDGYEVACRVAIRSILSEETTRSGCDACSTGFEIDSCRSNAEDSAAICCFSRSNMENSWFDAGTGCDGRICNCHCGATIDRNGTTRALDSPNAHIR